MTSAGFIGGFRYEIVNALNLDCRSGPLATEEAVYSKGISVGFVLGLARCN